MIRMVLMAIGAAALVVIFLTRAAVVAIAAASALLFVFLAHAATRARFHRSWAFAGNGWDRLPDRTARFGRFPRRVFGWPHHNACGNAWKFQRDEGPAGPPAGSSETTGHAAFDEYRAETLQRLEQEAKEFQDFLARLRRSRDKAEFDKFLSARRAEAAGPEKT